MRWSILLILAGVCLSFRPPHQADILQQPVTLDYQEATLSQILRDIRDQYQIKFAYLNNEVSEDRTFSIQADNQPLGLVLDELLEDTGLSYQVINDQIILKREVEEAVTLPDSVQHDESSTQPGIEKVQQKTMSTPAPPTPNDARTAPVAESDAEGIASSSSGSASTGALPDTSTVVLQEEKDPHPQPKAADAADTTSIHPLSPSAPKEKPSSVREDQSQFGQKISRGLRRVVDKLTSRQRIDSSDYIRRPFHIGLVYPISTNGLEAGRTVNGVSVHLLVGYAAGLDGVEFSAFGNIENDFVRGAQFAGFFNVVRQQVDGVQAAGFVNINGGSTEGGQLAGFANVSAGEINGLQGSGFVNVATGGAYGAQLAGFVNYTHHLRGMQIGGFINVASGNVRGTQLAGFVNYAHHVKGAQIGIFNVADSINGVPIGLVSIVRKNGYRRLELWYSEALQANIAFKMGVPAFYNMLVFGTQFADTNFRWGIGYGVGTLLPITSAFSMNVDLFAMQIHEDDQRIFDNYPLNLLNTLRLSLNLHLAKHLTLFAAPTFNVMVSKYRQPDSGTVGSPIAPSWTVYDRTFENANRMTQVGNQLVPFSTNVKMWPGFHVGLRF